VCKVNHVTRERTTDNSMLRKQDVFQAAHAADGQALTPAPAVCEVRHPDRHSYNRYDRGWRLATRAAGQVGARGTRGSAAGPAHPRPGLPGRRGGARAFQAALHLQPRRVVALSGEAALLRARQPRRRSRARRCLQARRRSAPRPPGIIPVPCAPQRRPCCERQRTLHGTARHGTARHGTARPRIYHRENAHA